MAIEIQLLGHASFRIITPEKRILLIDPWLSSNPFVPEVLKDQPKADLMLITHGHDDHMDPELRQLQERTSCKIVANNIVRWYLLEKGMQEDVFEPMNIGGNISIMDMRITMTIAQHIAHINETGTKALLPHPSVGFVLRFSDENCIYIAGDTGLFGDMKLIGELYQPNIAILPIGDRYTMGPSEAAYAIGMLGVEHVIPFHYGTFPSLTGTPEELGRRTHHMPELKIHVLAAGENLMLE